MAEKTKSNVKSTVFGDMRIVMFEVDATNGAGHAVTGLDYIHWAGVVNEDGTTNVVQVVKNSNDGSANTLNGSVYLVTSTGEVTLSVIAIGK